MERIVSATKLNLQRFTHAKKVANIFNKLLDEGYVIFEEDGNQHKSKFEIDEKALIVKSNCIVWFGWTNPPDTNKIFDAQFENWMVVHPKNVAKMTSFLL